MKVSIVFEEKAEIASAAHGAGKVFHVFLEGLSDARRKEIDAMTPEEQLHKLSRAEFWALRCYQITMHAMFEAGAVHKVIPR